MRQRDQSQGTEVKALPDTPPAGTTQSASRVSAVVETALIVIGLITAWLLPHQIASDAAVRFAALSDLLRHGRLSPNPYSMVGPLFSAPLWFLGQWYQSPAWWCARFNVIVLATGMLAAYLLLRARVDNGLLRKFFLLVLAASMFPNHLEAYYGEVFTTVCVGIGSLAAIFGSRAARAVGWVAVVLGVVNTPATILGLACVVVVRALRRQRVRYALVFIAAAALIGLEAWIRRGSPLRSGYEGTAGFRTIMPYAGLPGFSYPFFFGLLSIVLSFGKGLLFYMPGLFLPIKRSLQTLPMAVQERLFDTYLLWVAFLVGMVPVYASWWSWYGGWFWGPRFFLFGSLLAALVLAARLHMRRGSLVGNLLTLLALVLSVWVAIDGAVFDQSTLVSVCVYNQYALESLCHYTLEFSALWHPFVVMGHEGVWHALRVAYHIGRAQWLFTAFASVTGLYLAAPLLLTIGQDALAQSRAFGQRYLRPGLWRF